jgi:hypothetical protein
LSHQLGKARLGFLNGPLRAVGRIGSH